MLKTKNGTTKTIKIYSTSNCVFCHQLREFLKEHHIKFTDIDVGKDRKAAAEMIEKSSQMGVPVTDINGKIIIGFDRRAIAKELGIKE